MVSSVQWEGGEERGDLTLPPHQLAGVSEVQILGPATLTMEHFLADKVTTLRVAVRDVRGEGGLAGPAGVPLDDELGVEVGVRPDLLHHHGPRLTAQLHRPAELPALLSEVKLDICRISVSVGLSGSRGGNISPISMSVWSSSCSMCGSIFTGRKPRFVFNIYFQSDCDLTAESWLAVYCIVCVNIL